MTTRHAASLRSLVEGAYDKCFGIPTGKAAARELRMLCVFWARRRHHARRWGRGGRALALLGTSTNAWADVRGDAACASHRLSVRP